MENSTSAKDDSLEEILAGLDPLLIATGLAFAACAPGPAGEAGAIAAISFDVTRRQWWGVGLSAVSMIPLVGYVPAVSKIGWLLFTLNLRLKTLEKKLPQFHSSAENIEALRNAFGKYYRRLPKIGLTRSLRARLEHIMALDDPSHILEGAVPSSPGAVGSNRAE